MESLASSFSLHAGQRRDCLERLNHVVSMRYSSMPKLGNLRAHRRDAVPHAGTMEVGAHLFRGGGTRDGRCLKNTAHDTV